MRPSPQTLLCLDLSSAKGTISIGQIREDSWILADELELPGEFSHSEQIIPSLERLHEKTKFDFKSLSGLVTSIGPGSFTGLRVAIATLKGFSMVHSLPIYTVSGSIARAAAFRALHPGNASDTIFVYTHASLERYVRASIEFKGSTVQVTDESIVAGTGLEKPSKAFLIVDDRASEDSAFEGFSKKLFPLRSQYLGLALSLGVSAEIAKGPDEIQALSPKYFGSARF